MRKFALISACLLALAASPAASAERRVEDRWDFTLSVRLEPGEGAILVGFRRPDSVSRGKSGAVAFARYDPATRDLILEPRDAEDRGDETTYWVLARSDDRRAELEYALMIVSEGDYVLFGATPGPERRVYNTFCLGAPAFRVDAGEIAYFGEVTPYIDARMTDGERASAMAYSSHPDDARAFLAGEQPGLETLMREAELRNGATYGCGGQEMLAYAVPGAPDIGDAPLSAAGAAAPAASVSTDSAIPAPPTPR